MDLCVHRSSNNPASLTARLGATIDVEQNHVRFLGDLILNLWDCGGQDAFMDSYLTTQRSTIFQQVGVLIYVFDVETNEMNKDLEYYRDCLDGLRQFSPDAAVFLLVHKMDLVRERAATFERKKKELQDQSEKGQPQVPTSVTVFGTSIYDESLYRVCRLPIWKDRLFMCISRRGPASCTHSSRMPRSSLSTSQYSRRHVVRRK